MKLQVIDAPGKTIKKFAIANDAGQADVDLSANTAGLYLLKLVGKQGVELKKVIKQ